MILLNRVRKVDRLGIITTVAGNGTFGFSGDGGPAILAQLGGPLAVAADSGGNIFITDQNNQRIRKVNAAGFITTVAGNPALGPGGFEGGFSGDGGPATAAQLWFPDGVALNNGGDLFVADWGNNRIRKIVQAGSGSMLPAPPLPGLPLFH
jgi:trimeric autotransporter adhesin